MQTVTCYIGLGSNQEDPSKQLVDAIKRLKELPQCRLISHSSFYQSAPLVSQNEQQSNDEYKPTDYINAVVKMATQLVPFELLRALQKVEIDQGRIRDSNNRWASRILDLDILLYADTVIQTQQLIIPHYDMQNRDFVLKPLLEVTKEYIFQDGSVASDLLQQCANNNLRIIQGTSDYK
jgi:2-amino-4-hydroxy-6-hydroxymethyldihydropteridine diphosphokinase